MPRTKQAVPLERYTVMSQAEVARTLGISTMRVCQLEKSAMKKIAEAMQERFERPADWILTALRANAKSEGGIMRRYRARFGEVDSTEAA